MDIDNLRQLLDIPEQDIIIVAHIKKEQLERVIGALELAGLTDQDLDFLTEKGRYTNRE